MGETLIKDPVERLVKGQVSRTELLVVARKKSVKRAVVFVLLLIGAIALTYWSLRFQDTYTAFSGEGRQEVELPVGGYPFKFLYDVPDISVQGQLGIEDDSRELLFWANTAIYFSALGVVWNAVKLFARHLTN